MRQQRHNNPILLFFISLILIAVTPFFPPESEASATMPPQQPSSAGELEKLKSEEARLSSLLARVRQQKLSVLRSHPLTIGIVGFGRFGQFIAESFVKHGRVVGTSRSDYTAAAAEMGAAYIPLSQLDRFVMRDDLDVIVLAVSIVSFEDTVKDLVPHLRRRIAERGQCPLIVDVLSVKEHAREVLLRHLPVECDVLCTHPMFGPDSARHSWAGQNFVYERTRIDGVLLLDPNTDTARGYDSDFNEEKKNEGFVDENGNAHSAHENSEAHVEGMDRIERFLSIWEEEGCNMISLSCKAHDEYTANSQFITHLMGRILGRQSLQATPIDTKGFQSVLRLIETTSADSFDLFYGLYKFNRNSRETIERLRGAMEEVVGKLMEMEGESGDSCENGQIKSCL